jgi:hypothetical protein
MTTDCVNSQSKSADTVSVSVSCETHRLRRTLTLPVSVTVPPVCLMTELGVRLAESYACLRRAASRKGITTPRGA